jgi:tRNA A37 threonylcarbamoyladenosine synthetase subunit TsaC/SUA5/YrdC
MTTRDSARARTNHSDSGLHDVAAVAVRAGKLVVFPTETFYAIGADPMQPCALAAVVQLKGREPDKPIALIASDTDSAFAGDTCGCASARRKVLAGAVDAGTARP